MGNQIDTAAEQFIEDACRRTEYGVAITRAFEAYGSEMLSFLSSRLRNRSAGEEAFSMFAESLCQALPSFEFRCSIRAYLYTLARNAANRHATQPHNRRERNLPVSVNDSVLMVAEKARTETELHKRTEVKDKMRVLRERLPDDDQTILILYVDRNLPWNEIALVMHEGEQALTGETLTRESGRLRKRFERIKEELRELAKAEGLLRR